MACTFERFFYSYSKFLGVYMTQSILDVVLKNESPSCILGRGIPRFVPTTLDRVLVCLQDRFGHDAHFFYPEVLCALWNAHHSHLLWHVHTTGRPLRTATPREQWGVAVFPRKEALLWLYMNGEPFSLSLSVGVGHLNHVILTFHDPHMTNTFLSPYVQVLMQGLIEIGAKEPDWSWREDEHGTSYPVLYIEDVKTCAHRLESLVLGHEIYQFDEETQSHQPGTRMNAFLEQNDEKQNEWSSNFENKDLPF